MTAVLLPPVKNGYLFCLRPGIALAPVATVALARVAPPTARFQMLERDEVCLNRFGIHKAALI